MQEGVGLFDWRLGVERRTEGWFGPLPVALVALLLGGSCR